MKTLKIIFMGSPQFAIPSLKTIYESEHDLLGIITQPDRPRGRGYRTFPTPVKEWAEAKGMYVEQPQKLNDPSFINKIKALSPDLIVNVAFGRIIPINILELPPYGSINLHPSLLPAYRGPAPVQWAIFNGEEYTGVSVIYMEEELDAGEIILQEKEPIYMDDTTGDLLQRLAEKGAGLLLEAIDLIAREEVSSYPQNPADITYAPFLKPEDEIIKWGRSTLEIHNKVRGMAPSPGAYTFHEGSRLKIWDTEVASCHEEDENELSDTLPGTVIELGAFGFTVKTGDGVLIVKEVQPEGKKRMHASDFWRGYRLTEGVILGKK